MTMDLVKVRLFSVGLVVGVAVGLFVGVVGIPDVVQYRSVCAVNVE